MDEESHPLWSRKFPHLSLKENIEVIRKREHDFHSQKYVTHEPCHDVNLYCRMFICICISNIGIQKLAKSAKCNDMINAAACRSTMHTVFT